jgi:hypothetical protein
MHISVIKVVKAHVWLVSYAACSRVRGYGMITTVTVMWRLSDKAIAVF